MYNCIKDNLTENGYDIEEGMQLFEKQLKEIGYLSDSTNLYLLFKKQAKCESPLMINNYVADMDVRVNNFFEVRNSCYSKKELIKKSSKYLKVIQKLKSNRDGIKNPWTLWETIHSVIDEDDYSHPFYRMNALVTLHSWSLDKYNEYGFDDSCF
ncbi:hypothetical protein QYS48_12795 [Marivirga arenosa]|uniref:Uncharacterized protein n=1 Tax=Marivirga arenosa TaxID=3059076 RepID=A0AA49GLZ5_9BACT|nr:hypothetical protein [Marivirga sp. ABR2-2]WKK87508.1 hypothetical protein QYS48_12795 [Marivirga sp. ABR2-2]